MRAEGADHSVHKLHLKSLGLNTGPGLAQQGLLGDWFCCSTSTVFGALENLCVMKVAEAQVPPALTIY